MEDTNQTAVLNGGTAHVHARCPDRSNRDKLARLESMLPEAIQAEEETRFMDHRVLLLDTETTGLPRRGQDGRLVQPRIVAISWLLGAPDSPPQRERSYIVRPDGFTIPREATAIHGISTEYALSTGSSIQFILQHLRDDCDALRPKMVVAHNASFDIPVVDAESRRLDIPNPLARLRSICTMRTTVALCRIPRRRGRGLKWPSLQQLHVRLFARPFDGSHDSASDVRALFACFSALYRSGFYNSEFSLIQRPLLPQAEDLSAAAYVFSCANDTICHCLQRRLFGAPSPWPLSVAAGSICLLYNYDSHMISGVWRAVRSGTCLDAVAWEGRFPYQCQVEPLLSEPISVPRARFGFLAGGRIPNQLRSQQFVTILKSFLHGTNTHLGDGVEWS